MWFNVWNSINGDNKLCYVCICNKENIKKKELKNIFILKTIYQTRKIK